MWMALRPIRKLDLESRTLGCGVDSTHITRPRVIIPDEVYEPFFVGKLEALSKINACTFKYL